MRATSRVPLLAALGLLTLVTSLNCAQPSKSNFFVVKTRLVEGSREVAYPDVVETPSYRSQLSSIRTVAVRAPDVCANETGAQASGEGASVGRILQMTCGVEMAELERALAQSGYVVISWDVLRNHPLRPRQAAESLGADAILEVNSLERTIVAPAKDARWEREFFQSSKYGEQGSPASVFEQTARRLDFLLKQKEASLLDVRQLSVTVNATMIRITNGEAIWFYAWSKAEEVQSELEAQLLVACNGAENSQYVACETTRPVEREKEDLAYKRSGSIEAFSIKGRPMDEINATFYRLTREVMQDLTLRFAQKQNNG